MVRDGGKVLIEESVRPLRDIADRVAWRWRSEGCLVPLLEKDFVLIEKVRCAREQAGSDFEYIRGTALKIAARRRKPFSQREIDF